MSVVGHPPKINNKHPFSCSVGFCGKRPFKSEDKVVCMLYRMGLKEQFLAVDNHHYCEIR